MKLNNARFCPECHEIFSNKGSLRPENNCPSCTNRQTVSIFNLFLKRFTIQERGTENLKLRARND